MIENKNIRGTQSEKPNNLEVNTDTVYIRSNIIRIEEDDFNGWRYDEVQYSTKEYIELIGNENSKLNENIISLEETSEVNMLAMTEMYEEKLKIEQAADSAMIAITELYELLMGGM